MLESHPVNAPVDNRPSVPAVHNVPGPSAVQTDDMKTDPSETGRTVQPVVTDDMKTEENER